MQPDADAVSGHRSRFCARFSTSPSFASKSFKGAPRAFDPPLCRSTFFSSRPSFQTAHMRTSLTVDTLALQRAVGI
jgi:hypothetical protein